MYREFNADADATANEALDASPMPPPRDGIIVAENWHRTMLSGSLHHYLYLPGTFGLDAEGDNVMIDVTSNARAEASASDTSDDNISSDAEGDAFMNFQLTQWD